MENGYSPDGASYSQSFIRDYQKAQEARNNRLIEEALSRLKALEQGEGRFDDDEPFIIVGGAQYAPNNKMFPQDIRLLSHTQQEWQLMHADKTVTTQVIRSLRRPQFSYNTCLLYTSRCV